MLLTEHVDANIVNESGATPLHSARATAVIKVSVCAPIIIHTLLQYSNICTTNICVHLQPLLTHGANVNAHDLHGNTPLHMMCQDSKALECIADMVCVQWAYT